MPSITNPQLLVTTDRPNDVATVVVSCDVEFTEFEVNAMKLLGLRYALRCRLMDMDMFYPSSVIDFPRQEFPRVAGAANRHEHATFESVATMHSLHRYAFGKDPLFAELTLTNEETGTEVMERSATIVVDLAA